MTLDELKELARQAGYEEGEDHQAALVLLAAFHFGPKVKTIARFCGMTEWSVRKMAKNLRASGIWTEDGKIGMEHPPVDDPDEGYQRNMSIEFALHVLVAQGLVVRHSNVDEAAR
jgi:hypothetical protein